MVAPAHTSFVGRQREMAELKAALAGASSGQGRLVLLVGEPGIGKTRTAEELAILARHQGAVVLWGRCPEERGAPPYWPWVQAIRSYVLDQEPEALRSEMGAAAADIAEIVPDVRGRLPDLKPSPAIEDPEQARFRLFDSFTTFFKRASQKQPLVLVLDNLHWADPSSLRLLEFMAQELAEAQVLVIGTYRDVDVSRGHPLYRTLGELTRQRLHQRVLLRGLSQHQVGQVMGAMAGTALPQELVAMVFQQTEGNPLFVGEVVRLLAQEGLLAAERLGDLKSWGFRLPEGIREVIGRRLDQLSGRCNEVLTIASVIGREFSISLLERLIPQAEEQLLGLLEEALAARIIEELPAPVGHYQFCHALVQQTLAAELSTTRRVRLHARIAQALGELYGSDAEAHAAELAHHFAEAESVLGIEKLVKYSLLAGEQALASYAYEEALGHFERALSAKGVPLTGSEPARDGEEAALLAGLGRAQAATLPRYKLREVVTTLQRAVDYYVLSGDVAGAIAVAEYPVTGLMGHRTESAQLIARVLPLVPPGSHLAGQVLCNYGFYLGVDEADYQGAQEAFRQALAIAQGEGDTALEARVLANASEADFLHFQLPEAIHKSLRAIELARSAGEPFAQARGHRFTCQAMIQTGDLEGARKHASALLVLAEQLHDRDFLVNALFDNEEILRLVGDWATARDFYRRLMEVSPQDIRPLCRRALLEYQTGNLAEGQQYVAHVLEVIPLTVPGPNTGYAIPATTLPAIARICGVMDHLEVAEAAARIILASPPVTPVIESRARVGLGLVAVLRQDRAAAAGQYPALEPWRGTLVSPGLFSMDRLLGLLAQTMNQLDKASQHFEDALTFCRKAGYRPELAWTCHDYADMLLARAQLSAHGEPVEPRAAQSRPSTGSGRAESGEDRQKARSLLDEALTITQELGMKPLMEKVLGLQEKARAYPEEAPAYPDGLTQREVEVLRLIAAGKTDREIAEALVISIRTVGNHVGNILNKTNAANRTEAATYAAHHGLA